MGSLSVGQIIDRVYPEQKIHPQTSGRWSTTNPPLAQLPKRLRDIIGPDPGFRWVSFDWDQIELRLNAALSNDRPTLEAFERGWDIHTINSCDFLGLTKPPNLKDPHKSPECQEWRDRLDWEGKDDARRRFGKAFVYRLDYGGDPALAGDVPGARHLKLTPQQLVGAARAYLAAHPGKAAYRRRLVEEVLTTRTVRSFLGRRRKLSGTEKEIIREAYNHPMQAGVADVFNLTLIRIKEALPYALWVYGAHDCQKWAVPQGRYTEAKETIREIINRPWDVCGVQVVFPATFDE